jgi:hypothetical protein
MVATHHLWFLSRTAPLATPGAKRTAVISVCDFQRATASASFGKDQFARAERWDSAGCPQHPNGLGEPDAVRALFEPFLLRTGPAHCFKVRLLSLDHSFLGFEPRLISRMIL